MSFKGVSIITDDENIAAALYLAVSHYLAIKAKHKRIEGVPLADKLIDALEGVRNGFYKSKTMTQARSFEVNQNLLDQQNKPALIECQKELNELKEILSDRGVA